MSISLKRTLLLLAVAVVSVVTTAVSCEGPEPEPGPQPVVTDRAFDLYVCAVKHGGMGQNKNGTYVRRVGSLAAGQPRVEFTGRGLDITTRFTMESITRGMYYYQVPQEATGGFVKFHIALNAAGDETVVTDAETPFQKNTFYARKYTHAWLDEGRTLLVIGTDSDHRTAYWSKLREKDLAVQAEGTLDIRIPEGYQTISTSGLLSVRPTDGRLFYLYLVKSDDESVKPVTHVAVLDPATLAVLSDVAVSPDVMEETVSAAYGELIQTLITYDEDGTMYVAGMKTFDGVKLGVLRRIRPGETTFDPSWNGFPEPEGRLLTVQYVGNGRLLAYSRDEKLGTKIDSRSHFYSIVDLRTTRRERVCCEGVPLRWCSGRYSQRSAVVDGKAYIGVTEGDGPDDYPCVYIYDSDKGTVEKGIELSKGFCFDIIRAMDVE